MMKKKRYVLLFAVIWLAVLSFLYLPEKMFSSFENRYLDTFTFPSLSSLLDLSWMDDLENALSDQFRFRDESITVKTMTDKILGQKDNGRVYTGKDGYLFEMEKDISKQFTTNINTLKVFSKNTNIPIDFMPVYHSLAILEDKRPDFVTSHQKDMMSYIKTQLEDEINVIDVYDVLKNAKQQVYYRTDHHWTSYGAYLAYQEYLKDKSIPRDLNVVSSNFLGTLYHQAPSLFSIKDEIQSLEHVDVKLIYPGNLVKHSYYSESMLKKIDQYRYFLDGNYERIDIETETRNNEKLLIIKDSFANSFVPFLNEHYQYMTVIDPRHGNVDINELLNEGYTRVLFLYEMDNFANDKDISRVIRND